MSAWTRLRGADHLDTLQARDQLGRSLWLCTASTGRRWPCSRRRRRGWMAPWMLWVLAYLARIDVTLGRLAEAEGTLLWGIAAGERSLGPDHLGVLVARGELARVYTCSSVPSPTSSANDATSTDPPLATVCPRLSG